MDQSIPPRARLAGSHRALVVYYTMSGTTGRVARDLAAQLGADIEVLHDRFAAAGVLGYFRALFGALRGRPSQLEPLRHDAADYALVVMGTPVWAFRPTPAIRAYLSLQGARLPAVAFFVTSGNTDEGRIVPTLEALAGRRAVASVGFNAHELGDAAVYPSKLRSFAGQLQSLLSRSAPDAGRSVELAAG